MIYISLGSNLGSRINNLRRAVDLLTKYYLRNSRFSIVVETKPILPDNAPASWNKSFLNMIIAGETDLSPDALLKVLKSIEYEMGRPKICSKWSPRIIDLDILLWDGVEINTPTLKIPHLELINRPFLHHLLVLMGLDNWKKTQVIDCFTQSFLLYLAFVGIVNVTSDSFSDGGIFDQTDKAIEQILKLAEDGASIIEIGSQSTRPGATIKSPNEEYIKLKPVLDGIKEFIQNGILKISIDTFQPLVIHRILKDYPINWINIVKEDFDDNILRFIKERNCKICIMHSLCIPPSQDVILPINQNPVDIIIKWGEYTINRLVKLGFSLDNIIIDPGIGFGKSAYQNIEILRHAEELRKLNVQIMIGHSRKSYISSFSAVNTGSRDIETIAISLALKKKVDFLRVHNVKDHMRFFATYENFHEKYNDYI